ncbi:MAG: SurA N-terminal domain-containing protein [Candidatus Omnitrophota bacterium]
MLSLFRKKNIKKWILWGLALFIIPAFVLWGAGSLSEKDTPYGHIGTIGGKKISVEEFIKSVEDVRIGFFLNYFNQPEIIKRLQTDRGLLNRLAWENLMIKGRARKERVAVSDEEVVGFVTRHPLFSRDNVFDKKLYDYILRNSLGVVPRTFEENVRNFLISTKYKEDLVKNVDVAEEELLQNYKNEFEKARIQYFVIDKSVYKESAEVSDIETDLYYQQNKVRFKDPEKSVIEYVSFPHNEAGQRDKAIDTLKTVYEGLKKDPENFEKVAQEFGLEVKTTSPFSRDEAIPEMGSNRNIAPIAFRLTPLVDMIPMVEQEELGISHIIRVKESIPSRVKTLEEVKPFIVEALKDGKALAVAREKTADIHKDLEENDLPLKEISKKYGAKLQETELITRFDYIEGIGEAYGVIDSAVKLKINEISNPIEVRKGYALIELLEIQLIDEKKFEEEKEEYRNKLLSIKKMRALEEWLKKMRENSTLNVDLGSI